MKLIPFILFVVAMTGTPGPGNLTMMAIGEAAGFRGALRFLLGTTSGFFTLNLLVALGLGELIKGSPGIDLLLKIAGFCYILYLSGKILGLRVEGGKLKATFAFTEGFLIHPFSPKSWAMSLVGFTQFADAAADPLLRITQFVALFFIFQLFFHSLWCLAGVMLLRWMEGRAAKTVTRGVLVLLMVGATAFALLDL